MQVSSTESADVLIFRSAAPTAELAAERANAWANAYMEAKQLQVSTSTSELITNFRLRLGRTGDGSRMELRIELDRIEDELALATDPTDISQLQRQRDHEERRIQFQLDLIDTEVAAITQGITELGINGELVAIGDVRIIQIAAPPADPTNSPLWQSLILGGFAGLLVGIGAGFLVNSLDQAVKSSADLVSIGLPVLGSIPQPSRSMRASMDTVLADFPESPQAEGFNEVHACSPVPRDEQRHHVRTADKLQRRGGQDRDDRQPRVVDGSRQSADSRCRCRPSPSSASRRVRT